ncbi:MAG: hypothetical protein COZ21_00315 [Bacteroidetes bacterium CG_4_10_14_3_um_filter_31_20]|nr:MAG: hypothetical protein COZ21_00315 [Bacteroidetes bacterium CG_4_10_14_3_um_filter_31_20]
METTFRLKTSELPDFVTVMKTLLKKEKVIEITVRPVRETNLEKVETKGEYWARINRSIENLDKGENVTSFTEDEFDRFSSELREKYNK